MSSELAPLAGSAAATTDGDNRYQAVQQQLTAFAKALDSIAPDLERLVQNMRAHADRTQDVADRIERAELDPMFVQMTNQVAVALGGAAKQAGNLNESASEVTGLTHDAKTKHARMYQGLDDVRSGRRERTPKPGFFVR